MHRRIIYSSFVLRVSATNQQFSEDMEIENICVRVHVSNRQIFVTCNFTLIIDLKRNLKRACQ